MDWNGDGLNDLIVGEYNGHVKYFQAVTADSLTEMDDIKAAGEYINAGLVSAPAVFDWNNDSKLDLIVGYASGVSESSLKVFLNTGTPGNPVLSAGVDILCGGELVNSYGCTPCMADLDQDGLTDIIYGETDGHLSFCKNTGTAESPVFATPELLQDGHGVISMGLNSSPFVGDWNDDGFPDLVAGCGEAGYIFAYLSPYTTGISPHGNFNSFTVDVLNNPVCSLLDVSIFSSNCGTFSTGLYNLAGRLVQNLGTTRLYSGENTMQFYLNRIPRGVYLLRVSHGNSVSTKLLTILGGSQ